MEARLGKLLLKLDFNHLKVEYRPVDYRRQETHRSEKILDEIQKSRDTLFVA